MTLAELNKLVEDYIAHGYDRDVQEACRQAQLDTRLFIERTHPHVAFGGKDLTSRPRQIIIGSYKITAESINTNVYANYLARWYSTGAQGNIIRGRGPRRGQRGPTYEPRGQYFEHNSGAIEEYFCNRVKELLSRKIGGVF